MNYIGVLFFMSVFCVVAAFAFWPHMWDGDALGKWASVVTILSVASIPITYWVKQSDRAKEEAEKESKERARISKNLSMELDDTLDALAKHPVDLWEIRENGTTATFTNRVFNRDVYASLVFSGRINSAEYELQQKIQDVFTNIANHNEYLEYVGEHLQEGADAQSVANYCNKMEKIEAKLKLSIPPLVDRLRNSGLGGSA